MPQNAFFPRTRDLLVSQKTTQRHFFSTLHPLSMVIFATATVVAFVLLCDSRFNFHCYAQREATPTQKSARKCAATSRDFLRERLQSAFTPAESPNTYLSISFSLYICVRILYVFHFQVLTWFVQLCLAMKHIHDRKILHRDIKSQVGEWLALCIGKQSRSFLTEMQWKLERCFIYMEMKEVSCLKFNIQICLCMPDSK